MYLTGLRLLIIISLGMGNFSQAFESTRQNGWENDDRPTCEQLQTFWDIISRTVRLSQTTNEIPVIPMEVFAAFDHHYRPKTIRYPGHFQEGNLQTKSKQGVTFGNANFLDPFAAIDVWGSQHKIAKGPTSIVPHSYDAKNTNHEMDGDFGEFYPQSFSPPMTPQHWSEEPTVRGFGSSSLETKKKGETEMFVPQWGLPEEVGMFGGFVDLNVGSPHVAMTRTPKDPAGKWSGSPHEIESRFVPQVSSQTPCKDLLSKDCSNDHQCTCEGMTVLRCIHGKCISYGSSNGNFDHDGVWHDIPLPRSKLGIFKQLRKRSHKSIFM